MVEPARVLDVTALAAAQAGVVTRAQLEAELGPAGLRRAVRAGTWRPVHGRVLWQEKLREDALRELGLEVVRGYWSDRPQHGRALVDRLERAFARAARRTDAPSYGVLRR